MAYKKSAEKEKKTLAIRPDSVMFPLSPRERRNQATIQPKTMKTKHEIITAVDSTNPRSAWGKAVKTYALELLEECGETLPRNLEREMLNGAENWKQYSKGGNSLIYDRDIAERLCSPSELKRCKGGDRQPSSGETWLDAQARALFQAARLIARHA